MMNQRLFYTIVALSAACETSTTVSATVKFVGVADRDCFRRVAVDKYGESSVRIIQRQPLRVGVVGVGVMGSNHARVLAEFPGVTLAGVVDADRKQAHFVGTTLGCPALGTLDELLERLGGGQ